MGSNSDTISDSVSDYISVSVSASLDANLATSKTTKLINTHFSRCEISTNSANITFLPNFSFKKSPTFGLKPSPIFTFCTKNLIPQPKCSLRQRVFRLHLQSESLFREPLREIRRVLIWPFCIIFAVKNGKT